MDYRKAAQDVYESIGGKENIISAAHCATRLRLVIADNDKCDKDAVENIEGVKGVFFASGQLQIIFGTGTVNKVYDEFLQIAGIGAATKEEVKQAASARTSFWKRAVKTLGDVFVPIIPAIVASGLLMGLLEGLCKIYPAMAQSGTYTILHLFSNAAFVFLPVLIAISAARVFGGNLFLGAVVGMIMIHPDLLNAWSVAGAESIPTADAWFGLYQINLVGYQGHVIPVVIAVWIMCMLEKKLHKIVPEILDLFVTPLVTVLVTGYLTLTIIGPVFSWIENGVLSGMQFLITLPFGHRRRCLRGCLCAYGSSRRAPYVQCAGGRTSERDRPEYLDAHRYSSQCGTGSRRPRPCLKDKKQKDEIHGASGFPVRFPGNHRACYFRCKYPFHEALCGRLYRRRLRRPYRGLDRNRRFRIRCDGTVRLSDYHGLHTAVYHDYCRIRSDSLYPFLGAL